MVVAEPRFGDGDAGRRFADAEERLAAALHPPPPPPPAPWNLLPSPPTECSSSLVSWRSPRRWISETRYSAQDNIAMSEAADGQLQATEQEAKAIQKRRLRIAATQQQRQRPEQSPQCVKLLLLQEMQSRLCQPHGSVQREVRMSTKGSADQHMYLVASRCGFLLFNADQ
ncbi:unnamed protein product [Urochloa humidicola]